MPIEMLKSLRFITPGIIIILFWSFLGAATGDWKFVVPQSLSDIGAYLPAIVAAFVYYLTPLRSWSNEKHFSAINQNIRAGLVNIGGESLDNRKSGWPKLRRLFYKIVDSDDNLTHHAKSAYFNGYIWTTVADVKALSIIFSIYSLIYHFAFVSEGAVFFIGFSILAFACWPIGSLVTKKHKKIGDEQLEIIDQFHKDEVLKYFASDD